MTIPILSAASRTTTTRRTGRWPGWLREPLLHFVVLGALLFALDHWRAGREADPRSIVVGTEVDIEARQLFKASRGREPGAEELAALRQVWLDNEVLYREGLALQVDKGDKSIRERVIFKALSVVDANVKLRPLTMRCCAPGSRKTVPNTTRRRASIFRRRCWTASPPRPRCGPSSPH